MASFILSTMLRDYSSGLSFKTLSKNCRVLNIYKCRICALQQISLQICRTMVEPMNPEDKNYPKTTTFKRGILPTRQISKCLKKRWRIR